MFEFEMWKLTAECGLCTLTDEITRHISALRDRSHTARENDALQYFTLFLLRVNSTIRPAGLCFTDLL